VLIRSTVSGLYVGKQMAVLVRSTVYDRSGYKQQKRWGGKIVAKKEFKMAGTLIVEWKGFKPAELESVSFIFSVKYNCLNV
jgi:hypothetical protein